MYANIQSQTVTSLYNYPKFWAECYDPAPFLPMSRAEMDALGWDACDIILITGDAYIEKLANSPELRKF